MIRLAVRGYSYSAPGPGMVSLSSHNAATPPAPRPAGRSARCNLGPDIVPTKTRSSIGRHPRAAWISASTRFSGTNEIRALRAQLKRDLKARNVSIGALLLDPPPYLETAKVFDMLLALPEVGSVKATKILHGCRVSPSKTFGGLSERQRTELAERLDR